MALKKNSEIREKAERILGTYEQTFKAQDTKPVATRLTPAELEALKAYAVANKRRLSSILAEWIRDRMKVEEVQ